MISTFFSDIAYSDSPAASSGTRTTRHASPRRVPLFQTNETEAAYTAVGTAQPWAVASFARDQVWDQVAVPHDRKRPDKQAVPDGPGRTRTCDRRIMSYVSGVEPCSAKGPFRAWRSP